MSGFPFPLLSLDVKKSINGFLETPAGALQEPLTTVGGRMVLSQQKTAGSHFQIGTHSGGPH